MNPVVWVSFEQGIGNDTLSIIIQCYLFTDDGSSRVETSNETGIVLGLVS